MIKTANNNIYILTYHYVREIKKTKYSNLNGLEFSDFKKQIFYFKKNFNLISNDDFIEILNTKKIPKKKTILLTFDDGYFDHFKYVFPFLKEQKILANFYPSIKPIEFKKVLDVHKIHFILEKEQNKKKILDLIFFNVKKLMNKYPDQMEMDKINLASRYDDKKTILIKRLLQYHLPEAYRAKIVNEIFNKIMNIDEEEFSKKLYMSKSNLQELHKNNFVIGCHGYNHYWWNSLTKKNQELEIKKSINYFKKNKIYNENFSVCYPYGGYNYHTLDVLKKYKIKFALTVKVGSVNKRNIKNVFELPRYDTNDFK